jgi:DNA-binding XRE family transcriptional regulator
MTPRQSSRADSIDLFIKLDGTTEYWMQIKNICLFLSLFPIRISIPYRSYPRHWKSNQTTPLKPKTLSERLKKHRLELGWFQRDAAAKIGISIASFSDWERGITPPSRRMKEKIQEFLEYSPMPTPKQQCFYYCQTCGISESSSERCLFESVCKRLDKNRLHSKVHADDSH